MRKVRVMLAVSALQAFLCIALPSASEAQITVTFFDSTFDSVWTTQVLLGFSPASASAVSATVPAGGSSLFLTSASPLSPPYRRVDHNQWNRIEVTHLHQSSAWNRGMGPIQSLTYAYSLIAGQSGKNVEYRLLLQQGDSFYTAGKILAGASSWKYFANSNQTNLTAAAFHRVAGTGPDNPDFSCTGQPIVFGYFTANCTTPTCSTTAPTIQGRWSGIDDWQVTLRLGDTCCP